MTTGSVLAYRFEENGSELVSIPLLGVQGEGMRAVLDAGTWNARRATGWENAFAAVREGHCTVVCRQIHKRRPVQLARLVTAAGPNERVLYRDGDPLNLRRSNLEKLTSREARKRHPLNNYPIGGPQ